MPFGKQPSKHKRTYMRLRSSHCSCRTHSWGSSSLRGRRVTTCAPRPRWDAWRFIGCRRRRDDCVTASCSPKNRENNLRAVSGYLYEKSIGPSPRRPIIKSLKGFWDYKTLRQTQRLLRDQLTGSGVKLSLLYHAVSFENA